MIIFILIILILYKLFNKTCFSLKANRLKNTEYEYEDWAKVLTEKKIKNFNEKKLRILICLCLFEQNKNKQKCVVSVSQFLHDVFHYFSLSESSETLCEST